MSLVEELIQVALTAPDERKQAALKLLRGEEGTRNTENGKRDTEPYLTLKECARRLGLSACSLWRWQVPGHELGGRPKFRISEIESYLVSDTFKRRAALVRDLDRERRKATNKTLKSETKRKNKPALPMAMPGKGE